MYAALCLALMLALLAPGGAAAGSASAWLLSASPAAEVEHEAPAGGFGPQLLSGRRSELLGQPEGAGSGAEADLFQCVDPTRALFENFAHQYNRSFADNTDKLERLNLFFTSLKRTIMFNRIIQNEVLNKTNYEKKAQIRNYHFISPLNERNLALWYVDITDCELGLIKKIVFDLIYLIDKNELASAYRVALDNSQHLPLLNDLGFQQLADILLLRLYDRFEGDQKMDQLFRWPLYLKKLAAYAYNRREASTPDFKERLALISFAYPAYYKDLRYNLPAVNRTVDNLKVHAEHEKFNKLLGRTFVDLAERNKRLAVFRQHWTLVNLLNEDKSWQRQNVSLPPDWLRLQYHLSSDHNSAISERLTDPDAALDLGQQQQQVAPSDGRFKHTQFSDLTDSEFVAFLTNDFSLLENNRESANFIDTNFPIRPLDAKYRAEIAAELEQRRLVQRLAQPSSDKGANHERNSLALARKVVEELISDVGLPIGSVVMEDGSEKEVFNAFSQVSSFFNKPYTLDAKLTLSEADLKDERLLRFGRFKLNYGRFKAWFVKEGWQLSEDLLVPMLRLADLSWHEIKLSLFKICCLTEDKLSQLAARNATIQYMASNQFLCQQLTDDSGAGSGSSEQAKARELAALELYYYYSVHFNKHHSDLDTFNRRFAIFRSNIDRIRHHSCTRSLTLFPSLSWKKADFLNNIDSLDARRSYTDDINLDRFRYFQVMDLYSERRLQQLDDSELGFERLRAEPSARLRSSDSPSRAGISYRRDAFFADLLEARGQQRFSGVTYADRLADSEQNINLYANRYRENSIAKVYDLVMQRYRYCAKMVRRVELDENMPQQCQSAGALGDQASASGLSSWLSPESEASSRLQAEDQCAFYRLGLEPWAEGLMKQDMLSANLIQSARC